MKVKNKKNIIFSSKVFDSFEDFQKYYFPKDWEDRHNKKENIIIYIHPSIRRIIF